MDHEKVKAFVDEHIDLITIDAGAFKSALDRATRFLVVVAVVSDYKLDLEKRKAKVTTLRDAFYAHAVNTAEGKNVTEKKVQAESEKNYTAQRESVEELEAGISWARVQMEIFNNAHITFRNMAKGE